MSCTTPPNDPDTPAASPVQQSLLPNPIAESQAIVTNVNSQIDHLTRERDYYDQKATSLYEQYYSLLPAHTQLKQKVEELEFELHLAENVASTHGGEDLERVKNRFNFLSDRLTVMGRDYKSQLAMNKDLRNDNENLLVTIQGLEEANAECNFQAMKVERELKILEEDLNIALDSNMKYETRVGISELRTELQEKRNLIFKLESENDVLQRKWERLFEERESGLWEVSKVKSDNERFLNEIANLNDEKKVLQEQNKALAKEISALRVAKDTTPMMGGLADYTKAIDKDWMGLIGANKKLAREMEVLETEGIRVAKEKVNLVIQNNLLENRLKYLQNKVASYERKLE